MVSAAWVTRTRRTSCLAPSVSEITYSSFMDKRTIKENQGEIMLTGGRAVLSREAYEGNKTYHFKKTGASGKWPASNLGAGNGRAVASPDLTVPELA